MIVFRYLAREVLINMVAVSSVLLIIIMSGRFVKYLAKAATGDLDTAVLFSIMLTRLPGFLELILPLGLFLGFLLGYGRLFLESEMTVLEACGMSQKQLLIYAMGPASLVALIVLVLATIISPLSAQQNNLIYEQQEQRSELDTLTPGRFQRRDGNSRVIYTDRHTESGELGLVFVADRNPNNDRLQVTLAETGSTVTDQEQDKRYLLIENGRRYEGIPGAADYSQLTFSQYGTQIERRDIGMRHQEVEAMPTAELLGSDLPEHRAQLHWRFSLPVLAIVVTLLAVPLSRVNPRQGRFARLVPSILIYLIYIAALSNTTSQVADDKAGAFSIWLIHLLFIALALNMILFGGFWNRLYQQIPMPTIKFPRRRS